VREALIGWVRDNDALPRVRTDLVPDTTVAPPEGGRRDGVPRQEPGRVRPERGGPGVERGAEHERSAAGDDRVFSGDAASRRRGESFTGPDHR